MNTPHHTKGGTNAAKDVIYIDVDDEITAIIDKLRGSDKRIVALVLPKRATVMQSVVNMKLLKRAAADTKKQLVLITSETGLMPLAGSVGMHVAKSLNSKPEIPEAPAQASAKSEIIEATEDGEDSPLDASRTVGELSGAGMSLVAGDDAEDTIELDDEDSPASDAAKPGKPKKNRRFKIPNFSKFRILLALSVIAVLALSVVGYAAVAVWPAAKITIKTDSNTVSSSVVLTLKTGTDTKLDTAGGVIPAQLQEVKKTITQDAPATGQKNNGEKATGSVVMSVKDCPPYSPNPPSDLPAGSGISSGGNTYITQQKAVFIPSAPEGSCYVFKTGSVSIAAQTGGAKFNVTSVTFTVSGRSEITATGSASGGTDNIVKIVSQADVDGAKQKITAQDTKPIQQELKTALIGRQLFPVEVTFNNAEPETTLSVQAGEAGDSVTVTQTINYSMLGVKQDDLEKIVDADVGKKIDIKKQSILSHGLDAAFFGLQGVNADGASVSMQTTAVAGAELNAEAIKRQVAGKKSGGAKEIIGANPGVTDVTVQLSPFWVGAIPTKTAKITVVIQEPKVTANDNAQSP